MGSGGQCLTAGVLAELCPCHIPRVRISRLELFGFKSFPDRTTFQFGPGVSCVVGPNGSGKSNVVDALRWVIGEQSPRSLRGSEMSDVIFAGSADRRPVGFAEVLLTFVTTPDLPFPGDFAALAEIQVGRRLHRSGASEYLINQARVRRKDVVELLMDSGVGNNLYSFIAQGQVDRVITATPEERRAVIDEAAGIARYKARRAEAQGRLLASAAQLDRASDVVDELYARLNTLEEQVWRAAEFKRLRANIRHAELHLSLAKVHGLTEERGSLVDEQKGIKEQEAMGRQRLARHEADLASRREELDLVAAAVATRRDRLADLDGQIREQEATRRLHEERRAELVREEARASEELERAQRDLEEAKQQSEALQAEAEALGQRRSAIEERAVSVRRVAEEAHAAASEALNKADEADRALQTAVQARLQEEGRRTAIETRRQGLSERADALERQRERAEAVLESAKHAESATAEQVPPAEAALEERGHAQSATEAAWGAAMAALAASEADLGGALKQREEKLDAAEAWAAEVLQRSRVWMDATESEAQQRVERLEAEWRQRIAEATQRGVASIERAVSEARQSAQRAAAERVNRADEALEEAGRQRDAATSQVAEVQTALKNLEKEEREHELTVARAQSRLAAAQARLNVDEEALEDHPRLLDLVEEDARPALLDRLGERALRPVLTDLEPLVRAANQIESDVRLQAWYRPDGSLPPEGTASWLPSLRAALQGVEDGRGPAAGPAFRVSADGWVELGTTASLRSAAERAQAVTRQLESLAERTTALERKRGQLEADLVAARDRRTETEEAYRAAQEAASEERASAHTEATASEAEAERAAREAAQAEQDRLASARDEALSAAVSFRAERISHVRGSLDDALRELTERRPDDEGDARIAGIERAANEARAATAAALLTRDEARTAAAEASHTLERVRSAHQAAVAERERLEAELEALRAEAEAVREALSAANEELAASREALEGLTEAESTARQEVEVRQTASSSAGATQERATAEVMTIERELGGVREVGATLKAREQGIRARQESAEASIGRAQARAGEARQSIEASVEARDRAGEALAKASKERAGLWDALESERTRHRELQEGLTAAMHAQAELRQQVDAVLSAQEQFSGRLAAVNQELQLIAQRMDERYQVGINALLEALLAAGELVLQVDDTVRQGLTVGERTVEPVEPYTLTMERLTDESAIRKRVRALNRFRNQLTELGEVHLGAITEYRELLERYDTMEAQRIDLEESMRSIRAAIAKMNAMCTERFTDAFAQVKEHFQETYPRLVGGGSARLALTNEEDILESGVDIFVQPPGKRLQNLTLLSGGEKAMTAIALLIALFRVKPSPFCVLDEVDAPLDEANGARFNEMLKEMSRRSQFLVITHNRKTMECADTLVRHYDGQARCEQARVRPHVILARAERAWTQMRLGGTSRAIPTCPRRVWSFSYCWSGILAAWVPCAPSSLPFPICAARRTEDCREPPPDRRSRDPSGWGPEETALAPPRRRSAHQRPLASFERFRTALGRSRDDACKMASSDSWGQPDDQEALDDARGSAHLRRRGGHHHAAPRRGRACKAAREQKVRGRSPDTGCSSRRDVVASWGAFTSHSRSRLGTSPHVILVVGVNGSGKTTTIGKARASVSAASGKQGHARSW